MRICPHISYLCLFVFVWHFCLPALFKWWGAGLGWFISMPNKSQQPAVHAAHLNNLSRGPIQLFLKPVSSLIASLCGYPTLALGLLPFVSFFPLFVACISLPIIVGSQNFRLHKIWQIMPSGWNFCFQCNLTQKIQQIIPETDQQMPALPALPRMKL